MGHGKVFLVGAGPGDPDLLTVKAVELLKKADVVIYDKLVSKSILQLVPQKTEKIYVGKGPGKHELSQEEINKLIVNKALEGKTVVRLKGGDPFLFGRGGEEAEILMNHNIDFEVVPGITSALAASAYAGIPLTHRDYSSSIAIVTGHRATKGKGKVKWDKLANSVDTIVILMGVGQLKSIVESLMRGGLSLDTHVAIIERGTLADQRTLIGRLGTIVKEAKERKVSPPAVIVIGEVVRLGEKLHWFKVPICSKEERLP
ncbi:MAG: uroporphyrinogen-III C-methyltransferase [archaeon]|nr:uroporphyrinogen-III C-methyltransferase [archaeon]MCP8306514.1 uroporphyrinogen-III C-methyltransferase [archaeon]